MARGRDGVGGVLYSPGMMTGDQAGGAVAKDWACVKCSYNLKGLSASSACPECGAAVAASNPPVDDPGASAGVVESDRGCIQCSYNLKGLAKAGVCPECGRAVMDSLRGILLQFASREYVKKLDSGLALVLYGILLQIIVVVVGRFVASGIGVPGVELLLAVATVGVSLMILLGYFRYSEPDPGFVGTGVPDGSRRVLRVTVVVQACVSGIQLVFQVLLIGNIAMPLEILGLILLGSMLISMAAWLAQFLAVMNYTAWIASRVPDQFIVNRSKTYRWLLPVIAIPGAVLLFLGPLIALVMYWNLLDRLRKHTKGILKDGQPAKLPKMVG